MEPAVAPLRAMAADIETSAAKVSVISNKDGAVVRDGREVLDRIVNQIANPVRWDLCMETLRAQGVTGVIELAPGGTLAGLIKRATPEIEQLALKSPADIAAAREFAARHGKA
jgi:[acyl-carrier-protein] S-malonyltransferase